MWSSLEKLLNLHWRSPLFDHLRDNLGSLCCWPFAEIVEKAVVAWTFVEVVVSCSRVSCTFAPFAGSILASSVDTHIVDTGVPTRKFPAASSVRNSSADVGSS